MTRSSVFLRDFRKYVPKSLRNVVSDFKRVHQRLRVRAATRINEATLYRGLGDLGIGRGDVVLVHSALSRIGFVEGGAPTVIRALLELTGNKGTVLMPSFPFDTYIADYLRAHPIFHVRDTPSRMGKITELFRLMPSVRRSIHPTHPVAALGPEADFLTVDHGKSLLTFDANSPFFRLCELGGKILLLGVDFHSMTNLHVVEDTSPDFPYETYSPDKFEIRVLLNDSRETTMSVRAHERALSQLRDCNKLEPHFRDAGVLLRGEVGNADARLLNAAGVLETMTVLARQGITMYRDNEVPQNLRKHK